MNDLILEKLPQAQPQKRRFATMGSNELELPQQHVVKRRNISNFAK